MFSYFKKHGILGINARNLLYLRPFNPKKAIQLADDKLKTKHFLSARGIPVPKLLGKISNESELENFDWSKLPDEFVLKPNSGYGGEGILVMAGRKGNNFIKISGSKISVDEVITHTESILSGKFSLDATYDTAFFEQRLVPHDIFKNFTNTGLPDIRVVVHNLIPVMAMIRVPTKESDGKANVHLGGIGIGIDIAKGTTTHAVQYDKIIDEIPGFGNFKGIQIPFWDEILLIASQIQRISNLGYLACDIVIDKNRGPVILEINARAGLMVQIANLAPLGKRLERVKGIKVSSPEKGVRIGQDLFGEKIEKTEDGSISKKTVVGYKEYIEVLMSQGTQRILSRVRADLEKTLISKNLVDKLLKTRGAEKIENGLYKIKFFLEGKKIQTIAEQVDIFEGKDYEIIIGRRDLKDFVIDPFKPDPQDRKDEHIHKLTKQDYHSADKRICDIDQKTKLIHYLKPTNIAEEKEKFFRSGGQYNPQFQYPELDFDAEDLKDRLYYIQTDSSPLGQVFENKKKEVVHKLNLLLSRGNPKKFTEYSQKLYGTPSQQDYEKAKEHLSQVTFDRYKESDVPAEEVKQRFEEVFQSYGLTDWKVKLRKEMIADCSAGKKGTLFLKDGAFFSEKRIESLIRHEIETHILTAENGANQTYNVFLQGTANYLLTQEGLALYNQETFKSHDLIGDYGSFSVIAIYLAMHRSFSEVYKLLLDFGQSPERAFATVLKVKRGLSDTSSPGAFTKNYIYYHGFKKIRDYVENGGDLKKLYFGKMSIEEIDLYKKIDSISPSKYIPFFLQEDQISEKKVKKKKK